jgi:hypothetical protein
MMHRQQVDFSCSYSHHAEKVSPDPKPDAFQDGLPFLVVYNRRLLRLLFLLCIAPAIAAFPAEMLARDNEDRLDQLAFDFTVSRRRQESARPIENVRQRFYPSCNHYWIYCLPTYPLKIHLYRWSFLYKETSAC